MHKEVRKRSQLFELKIEEFRKGLANVDSQVKFMSATAQDITLGVAIGSSTQISMFVIPFFVVVGWMMKKNMDLNFQLFETATLFITVIVVSFMVQVRSWEHHIEYIHLPAKMNLVWIPAMHLT